MNQLNADFLSAEIGNARLRFRLGPGTGDNQAIVYRKFASEDEWTDQVIPMFNQYR